MINEKTKLALIVALIVLEAKGIVIDNQDDYGFAVEKLNKIKDFRKICDSEYLPIQQKTKEANQLALKNIKRYSEPLDKAKGLIQQCINAYKAKKDAKRKAEEDRLRAEAEKKEKSRLEKEMKKELKKEGWSREEVKSQVKEEIKHTEIIVPKIKIEDTTKTDGIIYREYWTFDVIDFALLPDEYKIENDKKIGGVVKSLKQNTQIPGIRVRSEKRCY